MMLLQKMFIRTPQKGLEFLRRAGRGGWWLGVQDQKTKEMYEAFGISRRVGGSYENSSLGEVWIISGTIVKRFTI